MTICSFKGTAVSGLPRIIDFTESRLIKRVEVTPDHVLRMGGLGMPVLFFCFYQLGVYFPKVFQALESTVLQISYLSFSCRPFWEVRWADPRSTLPSALRPLAREMIPAL